MEPTTLDVYVRKVVYLREDTQIVILSPLGVEESLEELWFT